MSGSGSYNVPIIMPYAIISEVLPLIIETFCKFERADFFKSCQWGKHSIFKLFKGEILAMGDKGESIGRTFQRKG